jgi:hypothetical protein
MVAFAETTSGCPDSHQSLVCAIDKQSGIGRGIGFGSQMRLSFSLLDTAARPFYTFMHAVTPLRNLLLKRI